MGSLSGGLFMRAHHRLVVATMGSHSMYLAFNVALHLLLAFSIVSFAVVLIASAVTERNPRERILRIAGLVAGAMVALGAQVAGIDYAQFNVRALADTEPTSFLINLVAAAVPALLGAGLGWYTMHVYKKSERLAMRVLSFIGMMTIIAFLLVYAEATKANGVFLGSASIPNVAFVTGLILAIIFSGDAERSSTGSEVRNLLSNVLRRRSLSIGDDDSTRVQKPYRRDPFSSS